MKLLTVFAGILTITNILCTDYTQNIYTSCELYLKKNIDVVENSINKDMGYLKEDLKIPQFKGEDENKVDIINKKINDDILPKVNEAEKTATEYYGGLNAEKPSFPFEINSTYSVTLNNELLISLYNDYYEFLGGAHGATTRTSYTIDKELEKIVDLKDLFKEGYDYKTVINNEIKKQIAKEPYKYFEPADKFKGISDNQSYYVDKNNLIIYYQQYEIAPYVSGIPEFTISLDSFQTNYKYR